jgi:cytochrome P450
VRELAVRILDRALNAFFTFLTAAGNGTTRIAATHGLMGFLAFPDQWDRFVQDPEGLVAGATEEILRWSSPVMHLRRNITIDTELRGELLQAGEKVNICSDHWSLLRRCAPTSSSASRTFRWT